MPLRGRTSFASLSRRVLPIALVALCLPAVSALAQVPRPADRVRIESADQLPRHAYSVPDSVVALIEDDARFAELAAELERDLEADLAKYEITDRATLKDYYGTLASLALIEGDYDTALAWTDSVRAVEDKPALRALTGTLERAMAAASLVPEGEREGAFERSFREEIAALPHDEVIAELRVRKARIDMASAGMVLGSIQALVQPAADSGEISRELAALLVRGKLYFEVIQPVQNEMRAVLDEAISGQVVETSDIWAARDVSLEGRDDLTSVVVAIWDNGIDVELYDGRLFVNVGELPGNGLDDDGNGFVDDVHGIAHDERSMRTTGMLMPLTYGEEEKVEFQRYLKGILDLRAGLDTPEAGELTRFTGSLQPDEYVQFFDGLYEYQVYAHGTHVAGIAVAGNPAARILVGRFTFDHRLHPDPPTVELQEAWAREIRETVDYFRDHGVGVVNMSWGESAAWYESVLEKVETGLGAAERRALARRLFDMAAEALRTAISDAPEILFVAGAGNKDEDNRFTEFVPASFDLPNVITVGAVDRAGDEAAFTSYGKVDVYANGYEVESYVPGGERSALSGTSMAAPQVTNLAAKLWAVHPELTMAEVRQAILDGADEKTIGEGKGIELLNPRRSFELVENER